jgi:hypothetical protein
MVDKRKIIADIKLKGFKKVSNKTVNEVFIKNYSEQYYIGVVLTKSHDGFQIEVGLLDMLTFEKFLEVEGIQDMGIFNLTYGFPISAVNKNNGYNKAIDEFIAKFDDVLNDYISSSGKFLVPICFTNKYRPRNSRIGIYQGLLKELAYKHELSEDYINSVCQQSANESNKNAIIDFKLDLLKKHLNKQHLEKRE